MSANQQSRFRLREKLFGKRLSSADAAHQAISNKIALAVFASDALSSVAYATQEILIVLAAAAVVLTTSIYWFSIPIALAIVLLLVILTISYRQTIFAYPSGGGAYIVARDNLGEVPAMVAAAALLTDYILTVAVSVSSGVEQLVSLVPSIDHIRPEIAFVLIAFITILNLRGVKESGVVFAVPTYFFIASVLLMIGVGFFKYFTGTLGTAPVREVAHLFDYNGLFALLILRAFSSGCTALTGVEAISNGIQAFKDPKSKNAATTLTVMSAILGFMFLGITLLANWVKAVPTETPTVISQVAQVVFDGGILYYLSIAAAILILILAANTSFADFPRLGALAAADGFLPRQLATKGRRLVFSWGIVLLAGAATLLVFIFDARVTALIPLYAIGVFLSFTLSQYGMVKRWRKAGALKVGETGHARFSSIEYDAHWKLKLVINAVGALASFVVMLVITATKLLQGAWIVVLLIPLLVLLFKRIRQHYSDVARVLSMSKTKVNPMKREMLTIVLIDDVHSGTVPMVEYAMSLRHPWLAVHLDNDAEKTAIIQAKWKERMEYAYHPLVIVPAPYRNLTDVVVEYVQEKLGKMPKGLIHVVMGQLIMDNYFEQALHSNTTIQFKLALQQLPRVVVTDVSYQLHTDEAENLPENIEQQYKTEHPELALDHAHGDGHAEQPQPIPAGVTLSGLSPSAELAEDETARK